MVDEAARPATEADLARLVELASALRAELRPARGGELLVERDLHPAPHAAWLGALLADASATTTLLVGTVDDHVVGYATAEIETLADGRRLLVVAELFVVPQARGVGVGEAIMTALLERARAAGCTGIQALVTPGNRDGKNFFERHGLTARAITVYRSLP